MKSNRSFISCNKRHRFAVRDSSAISRALKNLYADYYTVKKIIIYNNMQF